ncbi:MAG: hypothetical protein DRJ98_08050 [Thermoprotei archaeon]|nr:MAG: hypothetical protein DRJ98_08050 [Thermoprotei archaeon]
MDIPGVGRREVDVWCENAGRYVIEAKFLKSEHLKALSKIYHDYLPDPSISGGFAVLYPQELSEPLPREVLMELLSKLRFEVVPVFRPEDRRRGFRLFKGTLSEVANFVAELVLEPPEYIEPSVSDIISCLRDIAKEITATLRRLSGADLESLFGGKDVFRNILQYEEREYPVEDLRLAAAYILVNQLLFYHILSRSRPDLFPEIDPYAVRSPSDLKMYFDRVLDINYRAVLGFDVASKIPEKDLPLIREMIYAIKAIAPEKVKGDLLGTIFHDLVPFETRKSVAAFYTNVLAAELLAWLAIDRHDAKVADLAVGSGGLLVAAYRRKRFLLEQERHFTPEDHRRFVEEDLLGVDVMPFAANVAACHLALQAPEYPTNKVKIAVWDSTELAPGVKIPSIAALRAVLKGQATLEAFAEAGLEVKGVVSLREEVPEEVLLEWYDVIIMNPPFTRQERIPEDYKRVLFERFGDYKDYLHGQLGYYGYFILLADRFLREGGRVAFVLPATVLRIRSCEGIRRFWARKYHVEHIITTWHRSAFSESVRFREVLLVARKDRPAEGAKTVITVLKRLPSTLTEARRMADAIRRSQADWEDDRVLVKVRDYSELKGDIVNWFKYISVSDLSLIDLLEELLKLDKFVPLSKITEAKESDFRHYKFKNFHGFIIYDKSRAQKKIDIWVSDRIKEDVLIARHRMLNQKVSIPLSALGRGLRRPSYVQTMDITDTSDYLILSWFDGIEDMAAATLTSQELKRFDESVVEAWQEKFEMMKAHVLLSRRFDLSAPGTCLLAYYSDRPVVGVDMWCIKGLSGDDAKISTLWLNSTLNILQVLVHRTETRGAWMKIHDYMLDKFMLPSIKGLNKRDLELLLEVFDEVKHHSFPSILKQLKAGYKVRKEIDSVWLKVLGYKDNVDVFLDRLYKSLAKEIEFLKELMREKAVEA